jgi:energy-coupling factor transporter ATP-binding protein EcfA2
LDEPTNSLDPESIDALAKAINEFEGGMVLVSHDMRLISQVAKEIWICDNKTITPYKGDIQSFKLAMRAQMGLDDGTKQAPKALRGDASVKMKEATASTRKEPKKVTTKPKTGAPKSVTPEPKIKAKPAVVMEEDDITVATTITVSSTGAPSVTAAPVPVTTTAATSSTAAAPAKGSYVPPHLRKKMLEEQQSSS